MAYRKTLSAKMGTQDDTAYLLKYLLALELFRFGLPQAEIGKRVHMQTAVINKMLKGLNKKKGNK